MITKEPTMTVKYMADSGEERELELSIDEARALLQALRLGLRLFVDATRDGR